MTLYIIGNGGYSGAYCPPKHQLEERSSALSFRQGCEVEELPRLDHRCRDHQIGYSGAY
ncbi:MAG: hypothetical protein WD491_05545 [Balneolales bacterium]